MKNRFVLGIVFVLCLQVCFLAFNALERADERYYRADASTPLTEPVGDANLAPEVASIPKEAEASDTAKPVRVVIKRIYVYEPRLQFASAREEHKPQPLFPTVRITYPGKALDQAPSASRQMHLTARSEYPDKKERSLATRVLPVVKKPVDFFKFVGSKLR